ncbi:MAG: alanine racemase, partial [Campylobacterota bacterium]|nr:alanine racemase [Campylobacterota bacterium]
MGYIKLNKKAFFNNLDYFSKICGKNKLSIALKDNAYGHGIIEIASMIKEYGVEHIFVKNIKEANLIKKFNFKSVLVLYDIPKKYNKNIIISINSIKSIKKIPKNSKVELKLDTGMNRNGISKNEIDLALTLIKENKLILNGIFTHFCCADENNNITQKQVELFDDMILYIKNKIDIDIRTHCANSHGIFKVDMGKYDLARIGIGAYGYLDIDEKKFLKPILSLYANKIASKNIKKGDSIGYGSDGFIAKKDMVVSNYDIGYGDGFLRVGDIKKAKISNGKKILGRVSMDSFSIASKDKKVCVFN